jgi:hypothetical protein
MTGNKQGQQLNKTWSTAQVYCLKVKMENYKI